MMIYGLKNPNINLWFILIVDLHGYDGESIPTIKIPLMGALVKGSSHLVND